MDAPTLAPLRRGKRALALDAAADGLEQDRATLRLRKDFFAQSSGGPRDSLLSSWFAFHEAWFGDTCAAFPLSAVKIYSIAAMFKAGGYRATKNYIARAKEHHIELGHAWSDGLAMAQRKAGRSALRGIGPPRQSLPFNLHKIWQADFDFEPLVMGVRAT